MKNLTKLIQAQFDKMCATDKLFRSSVLGKEIWNLYLTGFGKDGVFRDPKSSVHNCNHCNSFIKRYGNVVAIDENYNIMTMFDIIENLNIDTSEEYSASLSMMHKALVQAPIANVFVETYDMLNSLPYESCKKTNEVFRLGTDKNHKRYTKEEAENYGVVKPNEIKTFHHFHLNIPKQFISFTSESAEAIQGKFKSSKVVYKRMLLELPLDTMELVRDLITQGSLLNGDAYLDKILSVTEDIRTFKNLCLPDDILDDNYTWVHSYKNPFAKFKNELIGVLCTELAEGEDLNKACLNWNKRVDPANYMKAVAPITESQKKNAQKFVEENGYLESFDRRFAQLSDIDVNEIIHKNVKNDTVKSASIFDGVNTKSTRHKRNEFKGIQEVSIDKFMKEILPTCTSVEAYLENRHSGNLVTLTTSNDSNCKPMFKWNNPYSWTYNGNLAGKSMIKQSVKSQGGKVDGVLRFSIMWSEGSSIDNSDLDAHCKEPNGNVISYQRKKSLYTRGNLDIDITNPRSHKNSTKKEVVENITYPSLEEMKDGSYRFLVHQFSADKSQGFKAEIEFNGELFQYIYDKSLGSKEKVIVAVVTLRNGEFTIEHKLPNTSTSKEMYGLKTQEFHKVNLVCLSPNYWGDNNVGHKHFMFMLDKCKTDKALRSFHNENLNSDLREHRKVLDILANVNMLEPTNGKELSGLGFNATVKDEVILRLKGNFKRVIKVKF